MSYSPSELERDKERLDGYIGTRSTFAIIACTKLILSAIYKSQNLRD